MAEIKAEESAKLRVDVSKLSEQELEDLAWLVVRKLKESMSQARDRSG